jgi:hypothetical protein
LRRSNYQQGTDVKFYKYWAKGEATVPDARPWKVRAFGGSDISVAEAQQRGVERAERVAAAVVNGRAPGGYEYGERPLREEVVEEIHGEDGVSAVITRNSYGSLVLNTSRVMFVDVDIFPPAPVSFGEALRNIWRSLRGKSAADRRLREEKLMAGFDEVCRAQPGLGFRIYRTCAGFRLLLTSNSFDPSLPEALNLLKAFGSDPLYIRLCKSQECFRARLTAKYWRCGAKRPPSRFPWEDAAKERAYRVWEDSYHRLANEFAVCELIGSRGAATIDESVQAILDTHDRLTMQDGAKLA